jgi:hypothetical protein
MDNNLTVTIIIYYMDGSDQWHKMYKIKLVISTQTDILQQHKLFLCGYAVLNRTVSVWYTLTVHRIGIELYTSLMTFKTFSTIQWSSVYD